MGIGGSGSPVFFLPAAGDVLKGKKNVYMCICLMMSKFSLGLLSSLLVDFSFLSLYVCFLFYYRNPGSLSQKGLKMERT